MFTKRVMSIVILSCCLSISLPAFFIETVQHNGHNRNIDKALGKTVFSFTKSLNGAVIDQWLYTNDLSRELLVGEHWIFESIRSWSMLPLINIFSGPIGIVCGMTPLFDNRFENFISNVEKCSEQELQEAVKDAVFLSKHSTKAYSADKLLDYLIDTLQNRVDYIKNHIKRNAKWDQNALYSMKKSVACTVGLTALIAATQKGDSATKEGLHSAAVLGLLPASYGLLKSGYKVLSTDPSTQATYLDKYEELLRFVQNIKTKKDSHESK